MVHNQLRMRVFFFSFCFNNKNNLSTSNKFFTPPISKLRKKSCRTLKVFLKILLNSNRKKKSPKNSYKVSNKCKLSKQGHGETFESCFKVAIMIDL